MSQLCVPEKKGEQELGEHLTVSAKMALNLSFSSPKHIPTK